MYRELIKQYLSNQIDELNGEIQRLLGIVSHLYMLINYLDQI